MVTLGNIALKETVRGFRLGLHTGAQGGIIVGSDQDRNDHHRGHHDSQHEGKRILIPASLESAASLAEYCLHTGQ